MAVTTDDIRVQQVQIYYRVAGSGAYIFLPLEETANHAYGRSSRPGSAPRWVGILLVARTRGHLTSVGSAAKPNLSSSNPDVDHAVNIVSAVRQQQRPF
jgi:hypothetical protein